MEDDSFRHDDSRPAIVCQMLGHVIDKQHFAAFGLHRKAAMRPDASFGRHKRRVGENDIGAFRPTLLTRQRVVFINLRRHKAVQIHVHQRQSHHIGRDVIAFEVSRQSAFVVGRERAVALVVGIGFANVFVGRDEEAGGAASGVEDGFVFLRVEEVDDEVDDVAGRAELAGVALGAQHG